MRGYSLDAECWSPEYGETSRMLDDRRALHAARGVLTDGQRAELARADERAAALYAAHRNAPDPYLDVRALADVVAIIESERDAAAA